MNITSKHHFQTVVIIGLALASILPVAAAGPPEDVRDFLNGERQVFQSGGHPKANGLDFKIEYPATWAAEEGNRPHIVQKFVSRGGRGFAMVMISVQDLEIPDGMAFTDEELIEVFEDREFVQQMIAEVSSGGRLLSQNVTRWEATPALRLVVEVETERVGIPVTARSVMLLTYFGNKQIMFQGSIVLPGPSTPTLQAAFKEAEPLFLLMANSFVLQNRWQGNTSSSSRLPTSASGVNPIVVVLLTLAAAVVGGFCVMLFFRRNKSGPTRENSAGLPEVPVANQELVELSEPENLREMWGPPDAEVPRASAVHQSPDQMLPQGSPTDSPSFAASQSFKRQSENPSPKEKQGPAGRRGKPAGIGGWLILAAIGVVMNPLMYFGEFGTTRALIATQGNAIRPDFVLLLEIWSFICLAMAVAGAILAILFFLASRYVPRAFVAFILAGLALQVGFTATAASLQAGSPDVQSEIWASAVPQIVRGTLVAVIWIPYFLISKRVKNTFV